VKKLEVDKKAGRTYSTAVGVDEFDVETEEIGAPMKMCAVSKICRCGSTSHKRTSHRDCLLNKKNVLSEKAITSCTTDEPINQLAGLGLLTNQQNTLLWDDIDVTVAPCNSSDGNSNL
jgi:hypothetical protein